MNKQLSGYEKLVIAAYGYFILLGLGQVALGAIAANGYVDYLGLFILIFFGVQFYYKNKIVNLILGILMLGASIFQLLTFIYDASKPGAPQILNILIALTVVSIAMSGILIFSYTKLSFKDQ